MTAFCWMTLMRFRCFVSVSASSGVPLIGSFRASSPGFRVSSCKISSRRVISYDQRSLSTRLSRSDLLSLQPHPCAMQYPGPYGESGGRSLGPGFRPARSRTANQQRQGRSYSEDYRSPSRARELLHVDRSFTFLLVFPIPPDPRLYGDVCGGSDAAELALMGAASPPADHHGVPPCTWPTRPRLLRSPGGRSCPLAPPASPRRRPWSRPGIRRPR